VFSVQCSVFSIQYSVFSIQYSVARCAGRASFGSEGGVAQADLPSYLYLVLRHCHDAARVPGLILSVCEREKVQSDGKPSHSKAFGSGSDAL
jgi:hypothetical protein